MGALARQEKMMRNGVLALILFASLMGAIGTEVQEKDLAIMTKEELIDLLHKNKKEADQKMDQATDEIHSLEHQLSEYTGEDIDDKSRAAHEKHVKAKAKKKEQAKQQAKLKKTEKLENILMHHGAVFLAEKAAKRTAEKGSIEQKKAVKAAAEKGARAGAAGPLKKVTREAAVKAVKEARKSAKKAGKHSKHEIRKLAVAAAQKAVQAIIAEQDKQVQKNMKKWMDAAIKKYPPSAVLAEDDDKPNVFTAPPGIHLESPEDEVSELNEQPSDEEEVDAAAAQLAADTIAPEK